MSPFWHGKTAKLWKPCLLAMFSSKSSDATSISCVFCLLSETPCLSICHMQLFYTISKHLQEMECDRSKRMVMVGFWGKRPTSIGISSSTEGIQLRGNQQKTVSSPATKKRGKNDTEQRNTDDDWRTKIFCSQGSPWQITSFSDNVFCS